MYLMIITHYSSGMDSINLKMMFHDIRDIYISFIQDGCHFFKMVVIFVGGTLGPPTIASELPCLDAGRTFIYSKVICHVACLDECVKLAATRCHAGNGQPAAAGSM